ncbi:hypothetical protein ACQ859_13510 [Roseateles chitinivorans]
MNKTLVYTTYGWLTLSGTLHFLIDVVSHVLRGNTRRARRRRCTTA